MGEAKNSFICLIKILKMKLTAFLSSCAKTIYFHNLGRMGYQPALELQKELVNNHFLSSSKNDIVLLVEHDPVYTVGLRDKTYSEAARSNLESKGAEFYRTDRGGLITFHGPGQLVVYPILNLKRPPFEPSVRWYVCRLESTIIELCKAFFDLPAKRTEHTGIWVGDNKIAALGIHNRRAVVSHGLALNCNTDLRWYDHIVPCGIADPSKWVTSLTKETDSNVGIEDAIPQYLTCFEKVFGCEMKELTTLEGLVDDDVLERTVGKSAS